MTMRKDYHLSINDPRYLERLRYSGESLEETKRRVENKRKKFAKIKS